MPLKNDPLEDLMELVRLVEMTANQFIDEEALFQEHGGTNADAKEILKAHWRVGHVMKGGCEKIKKLYEMEGRDA